MTTQYECSQIFDEPVDILSLAQWMKTRLELAKVAAEKRYGTKLKIVMIEVEPRTDLQWKGAHMVTTTMEPVT